MDYMDLYVKGGIVDTVNCQGDVVIHGGIIEKLITRGECKQYGGIIEQRVLVSSSSGSPHTQAKNGIIIREVSKQSDLQRIAELETANNNLRTQIETLKQLKHSDWELNGNISKRQQKKIKEMKDAIASRDHDIYNLHYEIKSRDGQIKALEKECERLRGREYITHLESENENLHNQAGYYEGENNKLRCQVADLQEQVSMTDRQQLLDEIDNLKDKLAKALNREIVQKQKAINAEREARIAKSLVWDDFKPTKEQVKAYYGQVRVMMDCELDY